MLLNPQAERWIDDLQLVICSYVHNRSRQPSRKERAGYLIALRGKPCCEHAHLEIDPLLEELVGVELVMNDERRKIGAVDAGTHGILDKSGKRRPNHRSKGP